MSIECQHDLNNFRNYKKGKYFVYIGKVGSEYICGETIYHDTMFVTKTKWDGYLKMEIKNMEQVFYDKNGSYIWCYENDEEGWNDYID